MPTGLHQRYVEALLNVWLQTSLAVNVKVTKQEHDDIPEDENFSNRKLIRSLMYLAVATRPDTQLVFLVSFMIDAEMLTGLRKNEYSGIWKVHGKWES